MINHLKYSKGLHILILCCFLLPFFHASCEDELQEEMAETEMIMAEQVAKDDTVISVTDSDNVAEENISLPTPASTNNSSKNKDDLSSHKIVDKVPILKPILTPDKDIYTGLATVIDSFPWIIFMSTPIAFLFLIVNLTVKIIDKNARRTIIFLDILAFGFLLIAHSLSLGSERLWGVWVTISLIGILTIYDIYINRLLRNELKGSS